MVVTHADFIDMAESVAENTSFELSIQAASLGSQLWPVCSFGLINSFSSHSPHTSIEDNDTLWVYFEDEKHSEWKTFCLVPDT